VATLELGKGSFSRLGRGWWTVSGALGAFGEKPESNTMGQVGKQGEAASRGMMAGDSLLFEFRADCEGASGKAFCDGPVSMDSFPGISKDEGFIWKTDFGALSPSLWRELESFFRKLVAGDAGVFWDSGESGSRLGRRFFCSRDFWLPLGRTDGFGAVAF
jgi:hypothetical protein